MSTPQKTTTAPKLAPTVNPIVKPAAPKAPATSIAKDDMNFLFDKENYMWMFGGIGLILLGFFLMAGGKSANPHEFQYDEIYSFQRITLAPIVILLGFGVEVWAIMKKPKEMVVS